MRSEGKSKSLEAYECSSQLLSHSNQTAANYCPTVTITVAKYCYTVAKPGPYMDYYSTVNTTAVIYYCNHQTAAAYLCTCTISRLQATL